MRIAIVGMGGHIGTGVARLLDAEPNRMLGIDMEPPRRRIARAQFHRVAPHDVAERRRLLVGFDPEVIVHAGVYEPHARSNPFAAETRSRDASRSLLEAAPDCGSLRQVVLRSSTDVYGRRRGGPSLIDETAPLRPTSRFGRIAAEAEAAAQTLAGSGTEPTVCVLRFAPIVGPYIPSPLGRYLRLPMVPVGMPFEGPLQLCHIDDAHRAFAAAVSSGAGGAFNIAGAGAVSGSEAARIGRRVPLPVWGPGWLVSRALTALAGAPLPEHCAEALTRGQTVDVGKARRGLGFTAARSTRDCVEDLYRWAAVVRHEPHRSTLDGAAPQPAAHAEARPGGAA